eukprot:1160161-Pelagomonas_calceolata.AAC.6
MIMPWLIFTPSRLAQNVASVQIALLVVMRLYVYHRKGIEQRLFADQALANFTIKGTPGGQWGTMEFTAFHRQQKLFMAGTDQQAKEPHCA